MREISRAIKRKAAKGEQKERVCISEREIDRELSACTVCCLLPSSFIIFAGCCCCCCWLCCRCLVSNLRDVDTFVPQAMHCSLQA